jgi:hypothetical protein
MEGSCEHGNESSGSIRHWDFLSSCATGSLSRRAQLHEVSDVIDLMMCIFTSACI